MAEDGMTGGDWVGGDGVGLKIVFANGVERHPALWHPRSPAWQPCITPPGIRHIWPGRTSVVSSPIVKFSSPSNQQPHLFVRVAVRLDDPLRLEADIRQHHPFAGDGINGHARKNLVVRAFLAVDDVGCHGRFLWSWHVDGVHLDPGPHGDHSRYCGLACTVLKSAVARGCDELSGRSRRLPEPLTCRLCRFTLAPGLFPPAWL